MKKLLLGSFVIATTITTLYVAKKKGMVTSK